VGADRKPDRHLLYFEQTRIVGEAYASAADRVQLFARTSPAHC
jgi:hypothetical protein